MHQEWHAFWIAPSESASARYGVFVFRKSFRLESRSQSFIVHVSADNRYKLSINDSLVSMGTARGDIQHWNFETIDIAAYLKSGANNIEALVWNEGAFRPEAQLSLRTAFLLQGNSQSEEIVNSDSSWQYREDSSYQPLKVTLPTYYVAGVGEKVDMFRHLNNRELSEYPGKGWLAARQTGRGTPKTILGGYGTPSEWLLTPSSIPPMELKYQRLQSVRAATGLAAPDSFPLKKSKLVIPAHTSAGLLLDQGFLTNAYFTILFSGGKNAGLSVIFMPSPCSPNTRIRVNRDEVAGKNIKGREDRLVADGSPNPVFYHLAMENVSLYSNPGSDR